MFKDKKEELRRLEEELLQEAQLEEEEDRLEEELEEAQALLDEAEDYGEESEETYFNYANRYGEVRAYNGDHTDEDMDRYSEDVYGGRKERGVSGLVALAVFLLGAIALAFGWCVLRYKGIL